MESKDRIYFAHRAAEEQELAAAASDPGYRRSPSQAAARLSRTGKRRGPPRARSERDRLSFNRGRAVSEVLLEQCRRAHRPALVRAARSRPLPPAAVPRRSGQREPRQDLAPCARARPRRRCAGLRANAPSSAVLEIASRIPAIPRSSIRSASSFSSPTHSSSATSGETPPATNVSKPAISNLRHSAPHHRLLVEQIGFGLLGEARRDEARAGAADRLAVGEGDVAGVPARILLDRPQRDHALALAVERPQRGSRALWSDAGRRRGRRAARRSRSAPKVRG